MTHGSSGSQCGGEPGGASESNDFVWGLATWALAGAARARKTRMNNPQRMSRGTLLPQQDAQPAGVLEQRRAQRLVVHRRGRVVEREQPPVEQPAVDVGDLRRGREVPERVPAERDYQLGP